MFDDNVAARQHLHNGLLLHAASCNYRIINGMIRLVVKSTMIHMMKPLSILALHPRVNIKYRYQTLVTGFII